MTTPLTPDQKDAERAAFEQWYVENAFDYERDPLGSKLCGDQWAAWKYRAAQPKAEPARLTDADIDEIWIKAPQIGPTMRDQLRGFAREVESKIRGDV